MEYAARLQELLTQVAQDIGVEVLEYDLFQAGTSKLLRIFVDREGGVTIQDCSRLSRELGAALDLEDLLPFAYTLEVSSPGLDRPLKTVRDFLRQKSRFVKIQLSDVDPILGRKIIGQIIDADDSSVLLNIEETEHRIAFERILSAKVEIQF